MQALERHSMTHDPPSLQRVSRNKAAITSRSTRTELGRKQFKGSVPMDTIGARVVTTTRPLHSPFPFQSGRRVNVDTFESRRPSDSAELVERLTSDRRTRSIRLSSRTGPTISSLSLPFPSLPSHSLSQSHTGSTRLNSLDTSIVLSIRQLNDACLLKLQKITSTTTNHLSPLPFHFLSLSLSLSLSHVATTFERSVAARIGYRTLIVMTSAI
jgi:hypothetical protein